MSSTGSTVSNSDYSTMINGYNATILDSDNTVAINSHENEVIVNGSGHAVIGLNKEGAGLDLLNTRNNSNWLGDTYLGEAIFRPSYQLECGVGNISLTGSNAGQGKHENLYLLNWSGLSPASMDIELPSATNNDYKNIVYQFVSNGTFDGTTIVDFKGFSGQLINGLSRYSMSFPFNSVTFTTSGSGWIVLGENGTTQASYLSAYNSSSISPTANVSASVPLPSIDLYNNISIVSGSRITFDKAGVYDIQFSAQAVKSTGTNVTILIWIKKNGSDVAWTNTEYILDGNANDEKVLAWNWMVSAVKGDYYEIAYVADTSTLTWQAKTGVTGPDIPSWIVTVDSV
jgi:superoxide dismutase